MTEYVTEEQLQEVVDRMYANIERLEAALQKASDHRWELDVGIRSLEVDVSRLEDQVRSLENELSNVKRGW